MLYQVGVSFDLHQVGFRYVDSQRYISAQIIRSYNDMSVNNYIALLGRVHYSSVYNGRFLVFSF